MCHRARDAAISAYDRSYRDRQDVAGDAAEDDAAAEDEADAVVPVDRKDTRDYRDRCQPSTRSTRFPLYPDVLRVPQHHHEEDPTDVRVVPHPRLNRFPNLSSLRRRQKTKKILGRG